MKQKFYQVFSPATLVLVLVAFLSTIFFATANLSFAASAGKKSTAVSRPSAVEYSETQIKQLQDALDITDAQQVSWNNVTQVMRDNAKATDDRQEARHKARAEKTENAQPMNAVEHMKLHREVTESHLAQMNNLIPPFEAFYSSLSDEQKKIADTTFRTGKHGKKQGKHKSK
jgi:protein CpxP